MRALAILPFPLILFAAGPSARVVGAPLPSAAVHVAPAPVTVADLTGHWEADVTGDGKTFTFLFDFIQKGDSLTGTLGISTQDRTFPITQGKVRGNDLSFIGFGKWSGTLSGTDLRLTRELDYGRKQEMKAHRTPKR